ncbi:succinate dehydrogenase, hydrophobic membrane anchor protein [Pacificimonas flava]|uniref:Succinate dehydrogenase hydrophobic membrane anchor subunit n=1 Tax=Pacificimonas flava TaxID=1234595 RepID=M2U9C5_9SPHN|nr:succinate dehydrogenase, hydrophobic membrane anchor protein [Pacificimonas flava]EMD84598.1 Succinate dehydrogenase hydrophobic membrane anchor protein [Pacificimonas flava]MBB5279533.1 succinate dehydrogenase / fumarate reductase membrane anchor subunit [Pacificimonas flava]
MFVKRGTPLGQVRGLGSAKEGAHHWWMQRLTAVGNLLLFTWFLASILTLPVLDHFTMIEWLRQPFVAVPMVLLTLNVFWHLRLGMQVMIEDYAAGGTRVTLLLLSTAFAIICAALSVFSILTIAFGA